jgi:phosphate transport system protein
MAEKRHTSTHYEKELRDIKEGLIYLGALVEKAIELATEALVDRNAELAHKVICDDNVIDQLDVEIEEKCIRILALRQPTARDQRIGDMAANIAEKSIILGEEPPMKPYIDIPRMAEIARVMIRESLDALVNEDTELARKVRMEDESIDNLNEQVFRELLTFMMEDPKKVHRALIIMQISKNLERISDHAVGIADMVMFMVTGKIVRHEPSCQA